MSNFSSIGDQARSYQLRLSQFLLKGKLDRLSKEVTTGIKDDIPLALNGDLSRISSIETRLTMLAAHNQNASEAKSMFAVMQSALERIQTVVVQAGPNLLNEAGGSSEDMLRLSANTMTEEFRSFFGALNTEVSGRHVFSGTRTDTAPLAAFEDMVAELTATTAGATTATDIVNRIDAWFDAPSGAGGFADTVYRGSNSGNNNIAVATDRAVGTNLTANSAELRTTLKGMAIMTYVSESGAGLDSATMRELFNAAGLRLVSAGVGITNARAMLGMQEAAVAQATTRNTAEISSLSIARSTLIAADPYETATALQETQASIESLYTLTSRLSRLSLTDYLS